MLLDSQNTYSRTRTEKSRGSEDHQLVQLETASPPLLLVLTLLLLISNFLGPSKSLPEEQITSDEEIKETL